MKKFLVVVTAFALLASLGAAVGQHGPTETGLFAVQIDDAETPGWQTVTIPAKSVEQGAHREGNDAKVKTENGEDLLKEGATLTWETGEDDAGEYTLVRIKTRNGKDVNIIRDKK